MPTSVASVPVILRPVHPSDAAFLWTIACDPETRANSLTPDAPSWQEHQAWLTEFLGDRKRVGWVVLTARHDLAAFVHVEHVSPHGAVIHVSVHPDFRRQGYATAAIYHATLVVQNTMDWGLLAYVKPDNVASRKAFTRCGYLEAGTATLEGQAVVVYAKG